MNDPFADYINRTFDCLRCGIPCTVFGSGNPDARLLRYSDKPGICACCAATQVFKVFVELIGGGVDETARLNLPEALLMPEVQKQFGRILVEGNADADLSEIDWERMVRNWELA